MKLFFHKTETGDIQVQIQKGTTLIDFNYIEMLKQLISDNQIECDWDNLDDIEKQKLNHLIEQIKQAVEDGLNRPLE